MPLVIRDRPTDGLFRPQTHPRGVEFTLAGDLDGGPAMRLDHQRFSYAGKFAMTATGKAVAREGDAPVAVASFNRDRSDADAAWIRYLSVRDDRRGEGIGARLAAFLAERLLEEVSRVRIAVNNPFAYEALYRAGFGFTGRRTGIAELVLERPWTRTIETYRSGLAAFDERDDLSAAERAFVSRKSDGAPPEPLE